MFFERLTGFFLSPASAIIVVVTLIISVTLSGYVNHDTKNKYSESGVADDDLYLYVFILVANVICLGILLFMFLVIPHVWIFTLGPVERFGASAYLGLVGYILFRVTRERRSKITSQTTQNEEGCNAINFLLGSTIWGVLQTIFGTVAALVYLAIWLATR